MGCPWHQVVRCCWASLLLWRYLSWHWNTQWFWPYSPHQVRLCYHEMVISCKRSLDRWPDFFCLHVTRGSSLGLLWFLGTASERRGPAACGVIFQVFRCFANMIGRRGLLQNWSPQGASWVYLSFCCHHWTSVLKLTWLHLSSPWFRKLSSQWRSRVVQLLPWLGHSGWSHLWMLLPERLHQMDIILSA